MMGLDQMVCQIGKRTVDRNKVRGPEHFLETDQLDSEIGRNARIDKRIVAEKAHVEGFGEAKQLRADIANADRAEDPADQALTHMCASPAKSVWSLPGEPILNH